MTALTLAIRLPDESFKGSILILFIPQFRNLSRLPFLFGSHSHCFDIPGTLWSMSLSSLVLMLLVPTASFSCMFWLLFSISLWIICLVLSIPPSSPILRLTASCTLSDDSHPLTYLSFLDSSWNYFLSNLIQNLILYLMVFQ